MSVDPLVAQAARDFAAAVNGFKRALDRRDSTWANATGTLELALPAQTYELAIVPDPDGGEYPVSVRATLKHDAANGAPLPLPSDHDLEQDLVSRNKRKAGHGGATANKRPRTAEDGEDMLHLLTRDDMDTLAAKLRDDIQEDTSECVNHVQRLLRRFKDEWHEKITWDHEHAQSRPPALAAAFPSPNSARDDHDTSTPDVVRREAKLLSSQIKWVEDCRRVAADIHDSREETWRTSSAGFHDRQRQDRETFQNKVLAESALHSQTLYKILNEVKTIGIYTQSLKWETPSSHLTYPSPSVPTPPAFPTQPAHAAPDTNQGGGRAKARVPPTPPAHPQQYQR
jgi:hypothetical protein